MSLLSAFKDYRDSRRAEADDPGSGLTVLGLNNIKSFQHARGSSGWLDNRGNYIDAYGYAGTNIDYAQAVGDLRNNSMVMAAIRWVAKNIYDARLQVVSLDSDNKETEQQGHELITLLENPNPFYDGAALWRAFAVSWILAGECYFIKARDRRFNSRVLELWYEPHWTIRPVWDDRTSDFITRFRYLRDGRWIDIDKDDVLVFYDGIDPETRRGISPSSSLLREYYTDNQAAQFMALLLKHGLVPPVALGLGDKTTPGPQGDELKAVKADLMRKMTGDEAGKPLVLSGPITAEKLGYDYSSVGMKQVRQIPEERFCAAIGISAVSLQLGAGLQHSTYNNVKEYLGHDYRSYIKPLHKIISNKLTNAMLPEFGLSKGLKVKWDYSEVEAMQPDKVAETKRTALLYTTGGIDRAEYREANSYKMRPEDKGVYYQGKGQGGIEKPSLDNADVTDPSLMTEAAYKPNGAAKPS